MAGAPVFIVPGRERYHEVVLAIWAVLIGALYLLGGPKSPAIAASLPVPWSWIFAAGLILGGGFTLGGSYWLTDARFGLELERSGLIGLSGALVVYVAAVLTTTGWPGLTVGTLVGAWIWANVMRVRRIGRDLAQIRAQERG
jgi:hypothetical protein